MTTAKKDIQSSERAFLNDKTHLTKKDSSFTEFDNEREIYEKEFDAYVPAFKGKLVDYYPNSYYHYILIVISLIPVYIVCAAAMAGQLWLVLKYPKEFSLGCGVLLIAYVAFCTFIVFLGSFGRYKLEREALKGRRAEQIIIANKIMQEKKDAHDSLAKFQENAQKHNKKNYK